MGRVFLLGKTNPNSTICPLTRKPVVIISGGNCFKASLKMFSPAIPLAVVPAIILSNLLIEFRVAIIEKIEKEVEKRTKEITQYIDPTVTTPQAIAAIPDAAFSVCKKAHVEAYRRNVILISYSMAIPYLLTFLNLNLQYSRTVDIENLTHYLMNIKRNLDEMDSVLENYIEGASSRITNATIKYRELIGSIRGSLIALETSKPSKPR